ncbi:MAG: hypothetical protein ACYC7D_09160 [Nitrososphaerales archaeon]
MKVSEDEISQIKRLAESSSIKNLSAAVSGSLSEDALTKIVASYLYFKSRGRSDRDFVSYLGIKETWETLAIGLNIMGALVPALIFDKEFRILAMKTGINKGLELGSKAALSKVSQSRIDGE